jgi:hypothetical protein
LWVDAGPLAGHYVILADTHYRVSGLLTEPPPDYSNAVPLGEKTWGDKAGLAQEAIDCQFVSQWDFPGEDQDFTVVGPISMVRVSR